MGPWRRLAISAVALRPLGWCGVVVVGIMPAVVVVGVVESSEESSDSDSDEADEEDSCDSDSPNLVNEFFEYFVYLLFQASGGIRKFCLILWSPWNGLQSEKTP